MNWVDLVIGVIVTYFLVAGWEQGVIHLFASLISFLASLWLALQLHSGVAEFMTDKFGLPEVWTAILGYVLVGFIAEAIISTGLRLLADKAPIRVLGSRYNQWVGAVVSVINSLIIVTFFLLLILALPIKGSVKDDISGSFIGSQLLSVVRTHGGSLNTSIDDVVEQAKEFLTIAPQSDENIELDITASEEELSVDMAAEDMLFSLVNEERDKIGIPRLYSDATIVDVARMYSTQMILDHRFSHIDVEGKSAGDRLKDANIVFVRAGENLAFAPDVETAHKGLMDSDSHRVNILDRRFRRVGIGIIRAGADGLVITQIFAD